MMYETHTWDELKARGKDGEREAYDSDPLPYWIRIGPITWHISVPLPEQPLNLKGTIAGKRKRGK